MEKLLYITANPKGLEKSKGMQIGEAFIQAFHEENPHVEINRIDLFHSDFPHMDADLVSARAKLAGYGYTMEQLEEAERVKIQKMRAVADDFSSHDYFVFVSPMWNLSAPAVLKEYLDNLFVAGKTFMHTPTGPQGLLTGKRAIHIQTRGGQHTGTPTEALESGDRYLKIALNFLGIETVESIIAEGFDLYPQKWSEMIAAAKEKAASAAKQFARKPVEV